MYILMKNKIYIYIFGIQIFDMYIYIYIYPIYIYKCMQAWSVFVLHVDNECVIMENITYIEIYV